MMKLSYRLLIEAKFLVEKILTDKKRAHIIVKSNVPHYVQNLKTR